jgi:hypothetical protein
MANREYGTLKDTEMLKKGKKKMSKLNNINYVRVEVGRHKHQPMKVTQSSIRAKPISWYICSVCSKKMPAPQETGNE